MICRLSAAAKQLILASVRSGGYPHVAAEAAGMPAKLLDQWITLAASKKGPRRVRAFIKELRQAAAQARLKAEIDAHADPKFWLKHGPGKETAKDPGWTNPSKAGTAHSQALSDVFASPEWAAIWTTIHTTLATFPEARSALADALKHSQPDDN